MSNYRAWNAFVGEINRRPEFDDIRGQLLEAGRQVILNGAPSPLSATQAAQEPSAGGNGWAEGAETISGRFQIAYGWLPGETDAVALLTHDPCAWDYVIKHGDTLAELVRRAGEHTEVCR